MVEVTSYAPGTPCWVDLMTSDPEGARRFYGELFGWEFEIGGPETGHYTSCKMRGRNVAGVAGDPAPDGMPTFWTTYLATDDLDGTAKRITDNGGALTMEPLEVMGYGRMLVATDPTGAAFGLWQAGEHVGSSLVNEPGAVIWNELATRDLDAARRFYGTVVGCDWDDFDTGEGGPPYATFSVGGKIVGGAMQMGDDVPAEVPANWTPCFAVADVDATMDTAQRLGGAVNFPALDTSFGRYGGLRDPQGGSFTVMTAPAPAEG